MSKLILGCLFSLVVLIVSAKGQIMSNPAQWYINNQIYSTRVFNSAVANSMIRKGTKGKRIPPAKTQKLPPDYTVFRESAASSLPKQLSLKSTPNQAADTERLFESFIDLYKSTARKDGFPANDLAYAFEYFVVNNYQIYHDLVDLPPDKDPRLRNARDGFERITLLSDKKLLQVSMYQEKAVFYQFKNQLSDNPEIQKMTDAQKQEAAEMLASLVGVNFNAYMKGINEGNTQLTDQARQMARDGLEKLLGVSINKIRITNSGLEL